MASPNKKPYLLRLNQEVYDALAQWADDEFRSVNAHMEYLLLESLRRAGRKPVLRGKAKNVVATSKPSADLQGKGGPDADPSDPPKTP